MTKRHITYMNCDTGEITDCHAIAMEWYRDNIEVALLDFSEVLNEWVERGRWIH